MKMFKVIVIAVVLIILAMAACNAATLPKDFIATIHKVETSGRLGPIKGDNGQALGPFQIHRDYWKDSGVKGSYSQCADYDYSVRVVTAYLNRYAAKHIKSGNVEALARIHNGGPNGYNKGETLKYWERYKICRNARPVRSSFRRVATG